MPSSGTTMTTMITAVVGERRAPPVCTVPLVAACCCQCHQPRSTVVARGRLEHGHTRGGGGGPRCCTHSSGSDPTWGGQWGEEERCDLGASEVQNKMIFMGHQISSCHVPVGRSFVILWKMLLSSWNLQCDHLLIYTNITFQYPKKWPCFVP